MTMKNTRQTIGPKHKKDKKGGGGKQEKVPLRGYEEPSL